MKKMRIWGCPGLCLWFLFSFLLVSCAVKREGNPADKLVTKDTVKSVWKLEVLIMPVDWIANASVDGLDLMIQPYNVRKLATGGNFRMLELSFRATGVEQVEVLKEQLLSTGIVEQVNIMKASN
jgi:hypothetical protein